MGLRGKTAPDEPCLLDLTAFFRVVLIENPLS